MFIFCSSSISMFKYKYFCKIYHDSFLLLLPEWSPCHDGMRILGQWCSTPWKEAKEALGTVPIELRFYSKSINSICHITIPHMNWPPPPPPYKSRLRIFSWLPSSINEPPLPVTVCLCSPLTLLPLRLRSVLGLPNTVGGSEPELADCIWKAPENACLDSPNSERPGGPAPECTLCPTVPLVVLGSRGGGGTVRIRRPPNDLAPKVLISLFLCPQSPPLSHYL